MPEFQKVEVPRGAFIGWGLKPPQVVTVKTISYDPVGATDYNDKVCPQLIGELTEDCDNYRDQGATKERLSAGELVTVKGSVAALKQGLLAADPKPGDIVRMDFNGEYPAKKGTGKSIDVLIARAAQTVSVSDLA